MAAKLKEKYSALDEEAKKRKKKRGYVYDGTKARLIEMRRDPANVSTPIAKTKDANAKTSDLSNLVQDISSVVPISRIDTLQTPEPTELDEQNFHESTRREDAEAEEECLREETRLVEDVERFRNRVNSDCELRELMRQRSGPADLKNANLNRETDTRELMRPRAGPSDLRYCKLQPEKDLRDLIKPKLKPVDTVDGQWTMDKAPSASALLAIWGGTGRTARV